MKVYRDLFERMCFRGCCTILTLVETLFQFFSPLHKMFIQKKTNHNFYVGTKEMSYLGAEPTRYQRKTNNFFQNHKTKTSK